MKNGKNKSSKRKGLYGGTAVRVMGVQHPCALTVLVVPLLL